MKSSLIPGILTVSAMAVAGPLSAAEVQIASNGPVVELNVQESIDIEPDIATISAGVTSEALTAVEAMRQNAVEMRSVIERIKSFGVAEKDIQTTGINLNARYDYDRNTQQQVFRGYQVSNRVSVKLRDIDRTGAVLDALVEAGATDLGGPSFSADDDTAAKEEARNKAMARARAQALSYARMAGYGAIRLLEVSESIVGTGPVPRVVRTASADIAEESAPVQPGMISSGVNLTVKYEMTAGD
ncbi:MAG: SIMPL domain-containing protein [Alphaproteobacteria bacterium]|nr:SIMPL domain-containing protein [Alphaproteobacteria bacterium]